MPYLFEHPFVANRFLTKPVVSEMELDDGKVGFAQDVINPFGITVHDAHPSLARVYVTPITARYWQFRPPH